MLMFSRSSVSSKAVPRSAGFSLIELLVSIGIIVLVLTIVITQQSAFNSAVLLRSQAYEIALDIKDVQLSAVSAVSDGAGNFRSTIGVQFDTDATQNQRYIFFIDADDDGFFDSGEERGAPGLLDSRFEIGEIRPSDGSLGVGNDFAILFERPNFDAIFYDGSGSTDPSTSVEIDIVGEGRSGFAGGGVCGEDYRTLQITTTGQVAVLECP